MRRSNRQVKRKKYTEDLDIKITDDEDEPGEDVDVTTPAAILSTGHSQSLGTPFQELEGDGLPSMQFFVVTYGSFLVLALFTSSLRCQGDATVNCVVPPPPRHTIHCSLLSSGVSCSCTQCIPLFY